MSHYMTARRTRVLPAAVPPQGPCPAWMRWFGCPQRRDGSVYAFDCDASVVETIEVTFSEEADDQVQVGAERRNVVGLYLFVKVRTLPNADEPRGARLGLAVVGSRIRWAVADAAAELWAGVMIDHGDRVDAAIDALRAKVAEYRAAPPEAKCLVAVQLVEAAEAAVLEWDTTDETCSFQVSRWGGGFRACGNAPIDENGFCVLHDPTRHS